MTLKVKDAYDNWKLEHSEQARNQLGESLFYFIKATIANNFGKRFNYLEDAVGESASKVLLYIANPKVQIDDICNFVTAVTCNTCLDMLRRRQKRDEQILLDDGTGAIKPRYIDKLLLETLLKKLSNQEKELVELKMDGISNENIALELNTTVDGVKGRWKRLLPYLRTQVGGG